MAELGKTSRDIRPLPPVQVMRAVAGEAMVPGDAVYLGSDEKVYKADRTDSAKMQVIGIVVAGREGKTSIEAGESVDVVVMGLVTGFIGVTPGALYYVGVTPGALDDAPPAGGSGHYKYIVARGRTTKTVFVDPYTDDFNAQ